MRKLVSCFGLLVICLAMPGEASFMAADLVFIPAAVNDDGVEGSVWLTDITITNVDTVAIDVALYMLPGGLFDNTEFLEREFGLGGRADESFGFIDESLADIPAGGTVVLNDPVGQYWVEGIGARARLGGIALFAYEAGSLDDRDAFPDGPVFRNVVAVARIFNTTTIVVPDPDDDTATIEQDVTFGQIMPGVPWYNVADGGFAELSSQIIVGPREDDIHRFNLGLFNTSDPQTTLTLAIQPIQPNGEAFLDENENPVIRFETMPPLSHIQYNRILTNNFGLEAPIEASLLITMVGWSTTSPNPVPTYTTYGSLIDGRSNDPTTLLPSFEVPYDIECVWSSGDSLDPAKAAAGTEDGSVEPRTSRVRTLQLP